MRLFSCILCVILCAMAAFPGQGKGSWKDGWLVKQDGDTLHGKIKYEWKHELVQVKLDNQKRVFTPFNTHAFAYYSDFADTMRHFFPVSYKGSGNMERPRFFELVVEGELDLLVRDEQEQRSSSRFDPMTGMSYPVMFTDRVFVYYFRDEDGNINRFKETKKALYKVMEKHKDKVKTYKKKHNLRHYKRKDLKKIVQYYNSLS